MLVGGWRRKDQRREREGKRGAGGREKGEGGRREREGQGRGRDKGEGGRRERDRTDQKGGTYMIY